MQVRSESVEVQPPAHLADIAALECTMVLWSRRRKVICITWRHWLILQKNHAWWTYPDDKQISVNFSINAKNGG